MQCNASNGTVESAHSGITPDKEYCNKHSLEVRLQLLINGTPRVLSTATSSTDEYVVVDGGQIESKPLDPYYNDGDFTDGISFPLVIGDMYDDQDLTFYMKPGEEDDVPKATRARWENGMSRAGNTISIRHMECNRYDEQPRICESMPLCQCEWMDLRLMAEMEYDISVEESCICIDVPNVMYGIELHPEAQANHGYGCDYTYVPNEDNQGYQHYADDDFTHEARCKKRAKRVAGDQECHEYTYDRAGCQRQRYCECEWMDKSCGVNQEDSTKMMQCNSNAYQERK